MEYNILGRTGLKVSVMGLGGGGHSRLGVSAGKSESESVALVREAMDSGVNFIDTARLYGTEHIVGKAIKDIGRDRVIISSKVWLPEGISADKVSELLERSLDDLGTDYIDVFHFHGVLLEQYDYAVSEIYPLLDKMRDQGKIRHIGITERFENDTTHQMLQKALDDDLFDVVMVGFNLLNQTARKTVLKKAMEKNVGVLNMFAVRKALSNKERLGEIVSELIENQKLDPADIDRDDPFKFLIHDTGALSLTDAAYRFCRHEPGIHVVLSGTSNPDHLKANIASLCRPPLPEDDVARLKSIFGKVDSVSGT